MFATAKLRHSLRVAIKATLFSAACAATTSVMAQSPVTEVEEVIVTGFRQSLSAAIDLKREEVGSVDAIVAEDIADFPDLNLAESIQRIPGVSIARDAGEGRTITVRGLGPEFTRVRLNGMEAMSANGGTDAAGGTNRARQFDFNTFASDLFNGITVRKTASAGVEEGSLGATVDLRTARPFDYRELTLVGSLTGAYNDLSEELDPRAAFLVSNTWADGRVGLLFSAAYTKRNLIDEGSSTVRWAKPGQGFAGTLTTTPTLAQLNNAFVPRLPRYDYYEHDQERIGLTSSLQFKPDDATQINLDVLFAKFSATRTEIFLEVPNFSANTNGITVQNAVIDSNNSIVYGVFNNVDIRTENRFDELSTSFTQVTLDGSRQLTDTLKLSAIAGYSKSDHKNPIQTTLLFDWNNIPSLTYDYRADRRLPVISYGTTNLTSTVNGNAATAGATSTVNSNGWYLSQIRLRPQTALNTFNNYAVDLEWNFAQPLTLNFGAQLKEFDFETTEKRRSNGTATNQEGIVPAGVQAIPIATYGRVFSFGSDLGIPAGSNTTFLIPDYGAGSQALGVYNTNVFPLGIESALSNNRDVSESDLGGYVELSLKTHLGGMPLRGNLGVRYVKTEQRSAGYSFLSGSAIRITSEREYTDTLPSMNVALDLLDNLVVRAAASKVMSRPALGNLTPGGTVNVSGAARSATLGNPNTDPTRANNYDLSVEWYFAKEALLSAAVFRKDIGSRPQALTLSNQVFTGNPFGIPDSVAIQACGGISGCAPNLAVWTFNTTINGPGGRLQGFEVSYQQPFSFLPSFLSNFGTILNYTGVESDITYRNAVTGLDDITDLTGLSKQAFNATLYYETSKFGARVSAAYRGGFFDNVPGRDGNNLEGTDSTLTIDASLKYTINDHWEVSLEALNLTDEFQSQWVDKDARRLSFYHHTGRNYLLGVRAKL